MAQIHINWDLTYACQLRCVHCYSQAGRRPTRAVSIANQQRIASRLIDGNVASIAFAGGEPLLEPGIWELADTFSRAGISQSVYTNGLMLDRQLAIMAAKYFQLVHISIDGHEDAVHDLIRGRAGSFAGAVSAVRLLATAGARVAVDVTLIRSTFDQVERFATELLPRIEGVKVVNVGGVVPAGLASRPGFGTELLTDSQARSLDDGSVLERLKNLVPPGVQVNCRSNRDLSMSKRWPAAHGHPLVVQVEPDGAVRAMPMYEGTVGSLLDTSLRELLCRSEAQQRSKDVQDLLSSITDSTTWANVTRRLDWLYGSSHVRHLIERRNSRIWMVEQR